MIVNVVGLGTDIVAVTRIERLITTRGAAFLRRWFSNAEIAYCHGKARPGEHFAARVAAKEAVVKALRLQWEGPVQWPQIEIVNDSLGVPSVQLTGDVLRTAQSAGVGEVLVSLSHCTDYATAVALAMPAIGSGNSQTVRPNPGESGAPDPQRKPLPESESCG